MNVSIGTIITVIGLLFTLTGAIIGILTFNRNGRKDLVKEAEEKATVTTKLDNISTGVQDIQVQMRSTDKKLDDLSERVTRVEESSKQAHKRLDALHSCSKGGE